MRVFYTKMFGVEPLYLDVPAEPLYLDVPAERLYLFEHCCHHHTFRKLLL
jgi:hypothetical protein